MHLRRAITLLGFLAVAGCHRAAPPVASTSRPAFTSPALPPLIFHAPGISGESFVDHALRRGLLAGFHDAGVDAQFEISGWVGDDAGIPALQAYARNHAEAAKISQHLQQVLREDPRRTIYLTSHSGGAGLAAWALEDLPSDVQIEAVLFLQPALSPTYDLSKALSHVKHAYAFTSKLDTVILQVGTTTFGTIDGVYTAAAGYSGFQTPATADKTQYEKLRQFPYQPAWMQYTNFGDHLGPMAVPFAHAVLAPTLLGKRP